MRTNTAATLYSPASAASDRPYTRTVIPAVMWQESAGINVQKYGAANAFKATVYIPDMSITPREKDLLIRGVCELVIDGTPGHTAKELLALGARTIMTADRNDFGSPRMQHWEVGIR